MSQRPQQNRHKAAAEVAHLQEELLARIRLARPSGHVRGYGFTWFTNWILFCLWGLNLPGFQAAAPPASGPDTGPYSGRPGRVRCLGVCNKTQRTARM